MRKLRIVSINNKSVFRDMFDIYMKELSNYDDTIVFDDMGKCIYKYFDAYWQERERFPICFYKGNECIGFTMIRELNPERYQIAEFYIKPDYRKDGNALYFAGEVVKLFEGDFEFFTKLKNARACRFWDKFVNTFDSAKSSDESDERFWNIYRK